MKMKGRSESNEYFKDSVHTILSYWFCVIATGIQLVLGLRHIDSLFGQLCLVEFGFGLSGLLFLDLMHGIKSKKIIYPDKFKKIHPDLFIRFAITFAIIVAIQFIFQIVPLITSTEMALAIVFCSVVEEYFFRGILLEPAFYFGKKAKPNMKYTIWKYKKKEGKPAKPPKEISVYEIIGIFASGIIFAAFHVNYYDQLSLMLMVLVGGWWLGAVYFWNKDLTSVILSHFLLNIIFVAQFWRVIF